MNEWTKIMRMSNVYDQLCKRTKSSLRTRWGLECIISYTTVPIYSSQLESLAQEWAEHLLKNGTFYHRPDNIYGENIYFYTASFYLDDEASIKKAVDAWYDEIDFYKSFDKEPTVEELTTGNPTGEW